MTRFVQSTSAIALLLAAGCSREEQAESSLRADPASETTADAAGPDVSVTAAPGVAFDYNYTFRLPGAKISAVQEQHAQACEKLGAARCRITGMHYRVTNERDITAMLAFRLDPAIAREFGKQGVAAVSDSDGMLVESEISGEDAGAAIKAADRSIAELREEFARTEARLAQKGLYASERISLQSRLDELRRLLAATGENRADREESLATTPMVFRYGSGSLIPGFDTHSPIRGAIETAGENFIGAFAIMLVIAATLAPWLLILGGLAWLWRRFGPRLASLRRETAAI